MRRFGLDDAAFAALAAGRPDAITLGELGRAQLSRTKLLLSEFLRAGDTPWTYAGEPPAEALSDPMTALFAATPREPGAPLLAPPEGHPLVSVFRSRSLAVRLEDSDPRRARLGLTPAARLTPDEVDRWRRRLDEAWRLLVDRHPAEADVLAAVLRVIVPVEPDPGAGGISATSANAYGAVAISEPPDGTALAVGLLHETRHSILNATHALFPLTDPGGARAYSPWRDDPRPPLGILHGAYAYLAVTRFWRTEMRSEQAASPAPERATNRPDDPASERQKGPARARQDGRHNPLAGEMPGPASKRQVPGAADRLAAFEFARWRAAVAGAADGLLGGESLTPAGRRFVRALRDEVAGWLAEPVEPDVQRLAEGANRDHYVRWRLRNLDADPAVLVEAWRAGRPAPEFPPSVLRPSPARALEHSERLNLVHRFLRDQRPMPGSSVRPGDDAWLIDSHWAARNAYKSSLKPGSDGDIWSGLALVWDFPALRERPEVVRALYDALGGVDLDDLARWLR